MQCLALDGRFRNLDALKTNISAKSLDKRLLQRPTPSYYENHRSVKWVGIYVSVPRPLSLVNSSVMFDHGRTRGTWLYNRGKPFGEDLRRKSIQDIIGNGRDFTTGFFVGSFPAIAKENNVKF